MYSAVVMVEKALGIFVCVIDGRPVWSMKDSQGMDAVVTFRDEAEARSVLLGLGIGHVVCGSFRFPRVVPDLEDGWASARALVRAGLFFELGTLSAAPAPNDESRQEEDSSGSRSAPPAPDPEKRSDRS